MRSRRFWLGALGLSVLASACRTVGVDAADTGRGPRARPVNPCTQSAVAQSIQFDRVDKVDLLFMVDNSASMALEQALLAAQLPALVEILTTGSFNPATGTAGEDFEPVADLNVGVITSDMGVGNNVGVGSCDASRPGYNPMVGDDGLLQPDTAGAGETVLNFQPGVSSQTPQAFAAQVGRVTSLGTSGCGFEQQLEAMLKAASPAAPTAWTAPGYQPPVFASGTGHAGPGGANDGLSRSNSVLALVAVTDEEDCSVPDTAIFATGNVADDRFGEPNLRCFQNPALLHQVDRYVSGFLGLRANPSLLVYAAIVGIPPPPAEFTDPTTGAVDFTGILEDPAMQYRERGTGADTTPVPSCTFQQPGSTEVNEAYPPRRFVEVGQRLAAQGAGVSISSICQGSFRSALDQIIRKIADALGPDCLPRPLRVNADGSVDCEVFATVPANMTCIDIPGAMPQEGAPTSPDGRARCAIQQQVPQGNMPPTAPGWYYDDFTVEGRDNCQKGGATPFQRIAFTSKPPTGTVVSLNCLPQATLPTSPDNVGLGTVCEPAGASDPCGTAQTQDGRPLSCDPISRSCGVACAKDTDCRSGGLTGFICDTRLRSEVDPDNFGSATEAYNYCVHPSCG